MKCFFSHRVFLIFLGLCYSYTSVIAQKEMELASQNPLPLNFRKQIVSSESFETVGVFDVDNDDELDIVSGGFWYKGPAYIDRVAIGAAKRYGEYYDDFSTIPLDVNGDGNIDFITGGWFGRRLVWKENPGDDGEWPEHLIAETGNIETPRAWDIDGDGVVEIIPNTPNNPLVIYRLVKNTEDNGTGNFEPFKIMEKHGHGLGFGDINGDGRGDLIVHNGWAEAPEDPFSEAWTFHQEFNFGTASIPILIADVDNDGLNDAIVGQGHNYGLHWYRQERDAKTKKSYWTKHAIDPYNSQYHTMELEDIDGDGRKELITGKRYRAHNGKDPGGKEDTGLYYFKWNGQSFSKQIIDYGAYGKGKGTGVYFSVTDLNKDGRKDIIVAGKDGLNIYYNQAYEN
jgi:hypothetical protein